jgi:chromosomal replication initiation ATPase DnaA
MQVIVDWSQKRQKHVLERMMLRGISRTEFYEALTKGRKRVQRENIIEAIYRYYSIVYEEVKGKDVRKIYPITVKVMV